MTRAIEGARAAVWIGCTAWLAACGPRRPPFDLSDPRHAHPAGAPARDPAAARSALAAALAAGYDEEAVAAAGRLAAEGGALDGDDAARVAAAIDRLDGAALERLWPALPRDGVPAAWVALRRALLAHHVGDDDAALARAAEVGGEAGAEARARQLAASIERRRAVAADVIAVLLPLSGPHAALGREVRAGVELAAAAEGDARLVFLDTRGDPDGAADAVERAVDEHHAIAALGPIGERESEAAAARAAELGLPIGLLAPGATAVPSAGVVRLWTGGEWEGRAAARMAADHGFHALAVLAPRDEAGRAQSDAFRAGAAAAGVPVTAVGDYDPTGTDLEPDLRRFLGLDPAVNPRLRRHLRAHGRDGWKTFSPDVPFDALYIPDDHDRAALVASYLPFFNVELRTSGDVIDVLALRRKHGGRTPSPVQLVGSSGWHHPGLVPRGGAAVEGALVIDVFAGGADEELASEAAARFAAAFAARAGRAPGPIAAQAHDAARLLLAARRAAARSAPAVARRDLSTALRRARLDDGACGPAWLDASGVLDREPLVLRVDAGELIPEE